MRELPKAHYALLLVVPLLLLILSVPLSESRGPYNLGSNSDPEYNYLLNSLSILTGHVPAHTDHPGTTLQEIGAVVLLGEWMCRTIGGNRVDLRTAVLSNPEAYLSGINLALLVLVCASMFWASVALYRSAKSVFPPLVFQCSFFLFYDLVVALVRVSPEPLLIATGFAMVAVLTPVLMGLRSDGALQAGMIFAFGLVTKVTFGPWIAVAALFRGIRRKAQFAGAAMLGLVIFLVPVIPRMPVILKWMMSIAIHSGRYGGGRVGLPSLAEVARHFLELGEVQPAILVLLPFYVLVLIALSVAPLKDTDPLLASTKRILKIGCAIIVIQLVITLKHFSPRYMVPCLVFTALVNAFVAMALSRRVLAEMPRAVLGLMGAAIFVGGALGTSAMVLVHARKERDYQAAAEELARKRAEMKDCVTIGYYRSSLPGFALNFGNEYSAGVHGEVLKKIYPDLIMYNTGFWDFTMNGRLEAVEQRLAKGQCVLMQGSPMPDGPSELPSELSTLPSELSIRPVAVIGDQALYRLSLNPGSK